MTRSNSRVVIGIYQLYLSGKRLKYVHQVRTKPVSMFMQCEEKFDDVCLQVLPSFGGSISQAIGVNFW